MLKSLLNSLYRLDKDALLSEHYETLFNLHEKDRLIEFGPFGKTWSARAIAINNITFEETLKISDVIVYLKEVYSSMKNKECGKKTLY